MYMDFDMAEFQFTCIVTGYVCISRVHFENWFYFGFLFPLYSNEFYSGKQQKIRMELNWNDIDMHFEWK